MGKAAQMPERDWSHRVEVQMRLKPFGMGLLVIVALVLLLISWMQVGNSAAQAQINDYGLKWDVSDAPTQAHVGLLMTFPSVKISNTGNQTWLSTGNNEVRLGYRWFYADGKPVPPTGETVWEDLRANLPSDIPAGGSIIFPGFQVSVPAKSDTYVLHLDLVQGASGWFATKGASDYTVRVNVAPKDVTPPTATVNTLSLFQVSTTFTVTWSGADDKDGTGIGSYDLQYKTLADKNWTDWLQGISQTSALFMGDNNKVYLFRARATDKAGNTGTYPEVEQASTHVNILPPSSRVANLPATSPNVFLVRWSGFDSVDGSDNQLFDVQFKDGDNGSWQDWQSSTPGTAAVFKGIEGHTYYFRSRATNYAGLRSDYSETAQASTQINPVLDSVYNGVFESQQGGASSSSTLTSTNTLTPTASTTVSNTLSPAASTTASAISNTTPAIPSVATPDATVTNTTVLSSTTVVSGTASSTAIVSGTLSPASALTGTNTTTSTLSTSAVFPLAVKNGDESTGTTGIVIDNPGNESLDVFLRFNDHNGAPITTTVNGVSTKLSPDEASQKSRIATLLLTVPAKSNKTVWAGNLPVATYNGWVSLSGNHPFQATAVRLPKAGQPVVYVAPVPATSLYLPYLRKSGTTGSSFVNLANPNTAPADVQITYYDASSGQIIATKTYQIPTLGSLRLSTYALATSNQSNSAAEERFNSAAIISSSVSLAANVELPQADGSVVTYSAITKASGTPPSTVFYKDFDGFSSELAIQNTGKDQASVKIEYTDQSGSVAGTDNVTVPSYGRVTIGGDALKDQPHFQGQASISTNSGNLAVVAISAPALLFSSNQQVP